MFVKLFNLIQYVLQSPHLENCWSLFYNKGMLHSIGQITIHIITEAIHKKMHSLWKEWLQGRSMIWQSLNSWRQIGQTWSFSSSLQDRQGREFNKSTVALCCSDYNNTWKTIIQEINGKKYHRPCLKNT